MDTIRHMKPKKQQEIALETVEFLVLCRHIDNPTLEIILNDISSKMLGFIQKYKLPDLDSFPATNN